jgi:ribonuclease inhibitor
MTEMNDMSRRIRLDASRLTNREDMGIYMKEAFSLPDYFGRNLDALRDCLEEVAEETEIVLDRDCVQTICENPYAYKVLLVIGRAAENNPYLHILFR